jgi:hypothetical protein
LRFRHGKDTDKNANAGAGAGIAGLVNLNIFLGINPEVAPSLVLIQRLAMAIGLDCLHG